MRTALFVIAMVAGLVCVALMPANAAPMVEIAVTNTQLAAVEEVGWRRRYYRGYAYPAPYAYYPPAYDYYPPRYYAPAYPAYRYYRPYGYYRPYYAPY